MSYCSACGTKMENNEKLCTNCGRKQQPEITVSPHRQRPARMQRRWPIVLISVAAITAVAVLGVILPLYGPFIAVPGDHATIQAAIDAAKDGDVIVIKMGTYRENINFRGKAITLRSSDPDDPIVVAATVIHGLNLGPVVTFASGETAGAVLKGFTITGGIGSASEFPVQIAGEQQVVAGYFGGGILVAEGSSPTITGNTITGNTAGWGGGIAVVRDSSPRITGNTITNNAAGKGGGGGIYIAFNSSPVIENNAIAINTAHNGGDNIPVVTRPSFTLTRVSSSWRRLQAGVGEAKPMVASNFGSGILVADGSSPTITGNAITGNIAGEGGGGIAVVRTSSPTITRNTIADNTAWWGGGIFAAYDSSPTIEQNTITGNTAHTGGAGIAVSTNSAPAITSNTITRNTAAGWGGGIVVLNESSPTIDKNNITVNTAGHSGGGLAVFNTSSPALTNNTIADNSASDGGAIWVRRDSTLRLSTPDNNTYRNNLPDNIYYEPGR